MSANGDQTSLDRLDRALLAHANINPATGLASDYLNHFNEAIMLLEMLSVSPECLQDFLAWKPMSYREHFAASRSKHTQLALAAYEAADPAVRHCLETLTDTMSAVLAATRATMGADTAPMSYARLATGAAAALKPLVARAGAIINGETASDTKIPPAPQAAVDLLLKG